MGSFSKLKDAFAKGEEFLLICHLDPDGDAIGALLALNEGILSAGKKARMVCLNSIPKVFSFLPDIEKIKNDFLLGNFDTVILLDNGDLRRTGFAERIVQISEKKIPLINIDHHPKNDLWKYASINYVNERSSSSSELIYRLFKGLGWSISPKIATALLTGIFTDTGGFHHPNTSVSVLDAVSELLSKGAKLKIISDNISKYHSIKRLKLWGIALNRLVINKKYGIAASILLRKDIEELDATDEEIPGLVNLINAIPESKLALLLYEAMDGKIKGSLRTEKDEVDVAFLAKLLGGGGHRRAAGFEIDGRISKIEGGWEVV